MPHMLVHVTTFALLCPGKIVDVLIVTGVFFFFFFFITLQPMVE